MKLNVFSRLNSIQKKKPKAIKYIQSSSDQSIIIVFFLDFGLITPKIMSSQERQLALDAAAQSVKRDKMSYRSAAKLHGLVHMTLHRYLKKTDPNFAQTQKKSEWVFNSKVKFYKKNASSSAKLPNDLKTQKKFDI